MIGDLSRPNLTGRKTISILPLNFCCLYCVSDAIEKPYHIKHTPHHLLSIEVHILDDGGVLLSKCY